MKNLKVLFTVLCMACTTSAWGAEVTLDFTSNNYSLVNSASTSENTFSVDGITFGYKSCYFNTSGKYLMMVKSAGVLYCKSPIGTNITSIAVTYSSGTSTSGYLDVFFSNAEKNTRATSGYDVQLSVAKSSTKKADNNNSGRNYFNISVHNANNVQVTKIVVTYESSGSGEKTPSFTLQPKSATYDQGATATALTITADGNPAPTYQWYSNTSKSNTNGTLISGETGASYTPSTATAGTFYYYCVATNSKGSATSDVATITVNAVYTVTWVVGSNPSKTKSYTTQVASGSKATPPTTPADDAIGSCANTFMGWSKSTLKSPTNTPPSDLFKDESPDAITEKTTFYAVFATKQTN